jgi:multiple sugar transport system substrate-binding protein
MEGFQEFMLFPDNLDDILARLDAAAVDIYAE